MLSAEQRVDAAPPSGSARKSLFSELTSATVLKFSVAYFCLVNSLAMVAVWTPLIVQSFSAGVPRSLPMTEMLVGSTSRWRPASGSRPSATGASVRSRWA